MAVVPDLEKARQEAVARADAEVAEATKERHAYLHGLCFEPSGGLRLGALNAAEMKAIASKIGTKGEPKIEAPADRDTVRYVLSCFVGKKDEAEAEKERLEKAIKASGG